MGAAAPAAANCPPSPPVRNPGPSVVRPASSAALGDPDDLGESPLIQLDPEEAAPEVRPRGADGSAVPEPEVPILPSWADQVARADVTMILISRGIW